MDHIIQNIIKSINRKLTKGKTSLNYEKATDMANSCFKSKIINSKVLDYAVSKRLFFKIELSYSLMHKNLQIYKIVCWSPRDDINHVSNAVNSINCILDAINYESLCFTPDMLAFDLTELQQFKF